jgi:ketosteroid isomerase-like protein
MKKAIGRSALGGIHAPVAAVALMALVWCGLAPVYTAGATGQKKKADKYDDNKSAAGLPTLPNSASDQIDHAIGEMLGAFQVGNVEAMHKYYADNATFVSGSYEPPVQGWNNYVVLYQKQKASFQGMQLIRRNTFIFVHQDVSWASYQWQFNSTFNGQAFTARGQTTLVLNKVGDNWVIVHNHTSEICPAPVQTPPTAQAQPQQ